MDATTFDISNRIDAQMRGAAFEAGPGAGRPGDFAAELGFAEASSDSAAAAGDQQTDEDPRIREASEQLVASAFLLPMLQQLRDANFASDRFKPNSGQKLFQQRLDTVLADRMASSPGFPIVDSLVAHMTKQAAAAGYGQADESTSPGASPAPVSPKEIDRHG